MLAIGMPMFIVATHHGSQHEHLIADVWERGDGLGYNVSLILGRMGSISHDGSALALPASDM